MWPLLCVRTHLTVSYLCKDTSLLDQGPTHMTSFNPNSFSKGSASK